MTALRKSNYNNTCAALLKIMSAIQLLTLVVIAQQQKSIVSWISVNGFFKKETLKMDT